jgi:alkylation response protein AidB-like acyl-CoA dehydrogenase
MSFELSPEQLKLKKQVRALALKEFAPKALDWDSKGKFAWENLKTLSKAGLMGLTVPKKFGGQERGFLDLCVALEELAAHCHITAMILQMNLNGIPLFVRLYGTEEQKRRFLPEVPKGNKMYGTGYTEFDAGSALTDIKTAATIRGSKVVVNGTKHLTTHGHVAHYHMVLARFGKTKGPYGLGLVIVPADAPGFKIIGREETMRGGNEAIIAYKNCAVPVENILVEGKPDSKDGIKVAIDGYNAQRCGNAAISVGLAQGAFDLAVKHARERKQFGRPIGEFQGIQWMLAEMATKIEAARGLVYRAAALAGKGLPPAKETSMAKLFANDMMLLEVVSNSLQIHGWKGYIRGNPIEWIYRAARGQSIAGGTTQMLRNHLGAVITGLKTSQRAG